MNDFFDLDAPLFRFLTRVADMVILSLLWLIGSLPPELPTGNFELSCSGSAGEHSAG